MPYIPKELRAKIDNEIEVLIMHIDAEANKHPGIRETTRAKMVTYAFFKVVRILYGYSKAGWYERGDVAKICRSIEREFERRFMDPYEDEKMKENGDV